MSGGGGSSRDDLSPGIGGGPDACGQTYNAPINSPKPSVLGAVAIGTVFTVDVVPTGTTSTLVVRDAMGRIGGSLTFLGYTQVINCIVQRGVAYTATVLAIAGGVYTVEVAPV